LRSNTSIERTCPGKPGHAAHVNYETGKNVTYRSNGVHAYCFEKAGGTYLYENGRFELVVDSD